MTFEQNFILKCLECMEQILSNNMELEDAIQHYTENKAPSSRYQLNSKITDSAQWNEQDKLSLSATVFEAIARSSLSFYSESDTRAQELNAANKEFLDQYLPMITEKTNPNIRIGSVKENIKRIKTDLKNKTENSENPYAFFTPVTAGLVVMAAAATTIALLSYKA